MSNTEKARILVVNDQEDICKIISAMLTRTGYECVTAADGAEALALLDSGEEFELLLSNLTMPNLDGIGLLERTHDRFPDMPFVIQSGIGDLSVLLAAVRNGAYDYLQSPFDREQLLALVRRALEYRRLKLDSRGYQTNLESLVAASADQLTKAIGDLEHSYDITLEGLCDALALKDAGTELHSKRVTAFAISMARAMGLPKDRIAVIARGAFLHDIGKIAIPEAILHKAGVLSTEEMLVMREHCSKGYGILKKIPFVAEPAEIVYSHHERFDGIGYPRGLKSDQIPLGARIVAVANTLDAITSDRPYRQAQSLAAARAEIQRWSGRQFDPEVVKLFLDMDENVWGDLRKEIERQTHQS
jgi:putative nucleotidyltransferase with HDIG domain